MRFLPSIRILSLRVLTSRYQAVNIGPFLDRLHLPGLGELEFEPAPFMGELELWTHLSDLLKRSKSPLNSLKVSLNPLPIDEFCECLRSAPTLETLMISLWFARDYEGLNCHSVNMLLVNSKLQQNWSYGDGVAQSWTQTIRILHRCAARSIPCYWTFSKTVKSTRFYITLEFASV
ncbi:hypothetical protein BD410DRAFT_391040 [Rickenella mellea]|uniref:F-box domain-containing protein n=1 Tax=Rickenella mellea TaxID=50990 RepID=A0A4Y7PXE5_9AGAM|nr:hypothetical protein BD410DRAFT_391040 [Rickenella mellea]